MSTPKGDPPASAPMMVAVPAQPGWRALYTGYAGEELVLPVVAWLIEPAAPRDGGPLGKPVVAHPRTGWLFDATDDAALEEALETDEFSFAVLVQPGVEVGDILDDLDAGAEDDEKA